MFKVLSLVTNMRSQPSASLIDGLVDGTVSSALTEMSRCTDNHFIQFWHAEILFTKYMV